MSTLCVPAQNMGKVEVKSRTGNPNILIHTRSPHCSMYIFPAAHMSRPILDEQALKHISTVCFFRHTPQTIRKVQDSQQNIGRANPCP